jgi:hypothetical protein
MVRPFHFLLVLIAVAASACGGGAGAPAAADVPADRRAAGEALLKQVSARIAAAQALTLTTNETASRTKPGGERETLRYTRELTLRRPGSLFFVLKGDRELEAFYSASKVTLVSHKEKVFAEFPAPATLDETVEVITFRYGIPMPIGEVLTLDPAVSLVTTDTTGGWSGREAVDGKPCIRLDWQEPTVDWAVWIEEGGTGLPRKLEITHKAHKARLATTIVFTSWNLLPQFDDVIFAPRVPNDYEGIAAVQRAAAVLTEEEIAAASKAATAGSGK